MFVIVTDTVTDMVTRAADTTGCVRQCFVSLNTTGDCQRNNWTSTSKAVEVVCMLQD